MQQFVWISCVLLTVCSQLPLMSNELLWACLFLFLCFFAISLHSAHFFYSCSRDSSTCFWFCPIQFFIYFVYFLRKNKVLYTTPSLSMWLKKRSVCISNAIIQEHLILVNYDLLSNTLKMLIVPPLTKTILHRKRLSQFYLVIYLFILLELNIIALNW